MEHAWVVRNLNHWEADGFYTFCVSYKIFEISGFRGGEYEYRPDDGGSKHL
jgi:hypothetical protein